MRSRLSGNEQQTFWECVAAGLGLLVFLVVGILALWPLGQTALVWRLAKGFVVYWLVVSLTAWVLGLAHRLLRVESDPPSNAYLFTNLGLSAILQAGWPAFAALAVTGALGNPAPGWLPLLVLHGVGLFSSLVAALIVGVFYQGTFYRLINAPLALLAYLVFAVWPALGRAIYGWFLALFGVG